MFYRLFVLIVVLVFVTTACSTATSSPATKSTGGVMVIPYGENNNDVKSGSIKVDNSITFIYVGKVVTDITKSTPICYAADDNSSVWVQSRYFTEMQYDIVIERTLGGAFVYLVSASDNSDQPKHLTTKSLLYPIDGRSYWISFVLDDMSKTSLNKKTFSFSELHVDCTIKGQRS